VQFSFGSGLFTIITRHALQKAIRFHWRALPAAFGGLLLHNFFHTSPICEQGSHGVRLGVGSTFYFQFARTIHSGSESSKKTVRILSISKK
jgi:hypothetical protein